MAYLWIGCVGLDSCGMPAEFVLVHVVSQECIEVKIEDFVTWETVVHNCRVLTECKKITILVYNKPQVKWFHWIGFHTVKILESTPIDICAPIPLVCKISGPAIEMAKEYCRIRGLKWIQPPLGAKWETLGTLMRDRYPVGHRLRYQVNPIRSNNLQCVASRKPNVNKFMKGYTPRPERMWSKNKRMVDYMELIGNYSPKSVVISCDGKHEWITDVRGSNRSLEVWRNLDLLRKCDRH